MRDRQPSPVSTGRRRRLRVVGAVSAVLSMTALAACSDDEETAPTEPAVVATTAEPSVVSATEAPPTTEPAPETTELAPATTEAAPETTVADAEVSAEAVDWALEYIGAAAGEASGEPVVIGVVDWADYPAEPYTSAMADFISSELGGIDGRPIEIVTCDGGSDPVGCAEQLGSDPDVTAVLENLQFPEKGEFEEALADRKPMLSVDPSRGTGTVSFFTGPLQITSAAGLAAASLLPDGIGKIGVIGANGSEIILENASRYVAPDAEIVLITTPSLFEDTLDAAQLATAIAQADAQDVDVVVVDALAACDFAAPAFEQIGEEPEFVYPYWCVGQDGYVVGEQIDFNAPDLESGEMTVVEGVSAYLSEPADLTIESGYLLWPAADLLRLTKVLNEIGVENASSGLQTALAAYVGPALLGVGNADCTVLPPTVVSAPGACTTLVEVSRRANGVLEYVEPADLNH